MVERFGENPIVCYDKDKVLLQLELDGMDRCEAKEFFYFNQLGSWMGDSTPCFLSANNNAKLRHRPTNDETSQGINHIQIT